MTIATRRRTRLAFVLLALLAAAVAREVFSLADKERWNGLIESGRLPETDAKSPVEARFAVAASLAGKGEDHAALSRYRELQPDSRLGLAARYNTANLLMRQAIALQDSPARGQAIPLIELAKETYREVLRAEPDNWNARYNLERAQRLLPDPEDGEPTTLETPRNAERAATTMRGYSPGLP